MTAPKIVFVTGAGSGIGRATALAFAARGATLIVAGRTDATLNQTADLIKQRGGTCRTAIADVSDSASITAAINDAAKNLGPIELLVNNAAMAICAKTADTPIDDFDRMLATNAAAVFYACRAVWPIMAAAGGGIIINISSLAAGDSFPGLVPYGATKAFVEQLTRGLAQEGRKPNIRVFGIAPGTVETQMLRSAFPDYPHDKTLDPEDVANLAVTLTDPATRYSTGQTIRITK